MSMISLVIAPLMEGKADWFEWYWGVIPLVVMIVGTYIVYRLFWKHGIDITADVGGGSPEKAAETTGKADEEEGADDEMEAWGISTEVKATGAAKADSPTL